MVLLDCYGHGYAAQKNFLLFDEYHSAETYLLWWKWSWVEADMTGWMRCLSGEWISGCMDGF